MSLYNNYTQNKNKKDIYASFEIGDYQKLELIGRGQFSTVYKVKHKSFGDLYAMKVIGKRPENQKAEQQKQIKREVENLKKCYHWENNYNTVKLFNFFDTKDQYVLIFNYCDTTLEEYVKEKYLNNKMPLKDIKLLFLQLNQGFQNLYEENVIHRDIKINNILIEYRFGDKNDYIPRLGDFGISRENSTENNPMTASISWLLLSAPEILVDGTDYSFKSDLWSIGVLLYKLAFRKYPYEGKGPIQIYSQIMNGPNKLEKSGDKNFDDLIKRLLHKDKEMRINYIDYFNHPFFKFNEPESVVIFNEQYNMNISSYNREFRVESCNGNGLLKDLCYVEFVKLIELNLQFCEISDLNPLTHDIFKNLKFINLQYNRITNLMPLQKAKFLDLIELYLGLNQITDISPLENIHFRRLKIL